MLEIIFSEMVHYPYGIGTNGQVLLQMEQTSMGDASGGGVSLTGSTDNTVYTVTGMIQLLVK